MYILLLGAVSFTYLCTWAEIFIQSYSHGHIEVYIHACIGVPCICVQAVAFMSFGMRQLLGHGRWSQFDSCAGVAVSPRIDTFCIEGHALPRLSSCGQRRWLCGSCISGDVNGTACTGARDVCASCAGKHDPLHGCTLRYTHVNKPQSSIMLEYIIKYNF